MTMYCYGGEHPSYSLGQVSIFFLLGEVLLETVPVNNLLSIRLKMPACRIAEIQTDGFSPPQNVLIFFFLQTSSLKRTTDVMFGGKQVVVCGYGEVR